MSLHRAFLAFGRKGRGDSKPMLTANGLRGATLHTGTGLEPLRSVEVTWGRDGHILSMTWEGFRDLVASALDEDRVPRLGDRPSA